jgi:hypothetical protein
MFEVPRRISLGHSNGRISKGQSPTAHFSNNDT